MESEENENVMIPPTPIFRFSLRRKGHYYSDYDSGSVSSELSHHS